MKPNLAGWTTMDLFREIRRNRAHGVHIWSACSCGRSAGRGSVCSLCIDEELSRRLKRKKGGTK